MTKRPISNLVAAFWQWHDLAHGETPNAEKASRYWFAVEEVWAIQAKGGQASVDLVVALAESAHTEEQLVFVGAGPLEDIVYQCPNSPPIDELAVALRENLKVREAFQASYLSVFPKDAVERLRRYKRDVD